MAGFDALVGPTVAITPPTVVAVADLADYSRLNMLALRNTSTVNMLEMCAVTVPVALDAAGLPVGLQIACPGGDDARALALATVCERVLGPARRRLGVPPLCAA